MDREELQKDIVTHLNRCSMGKEIHQAIYDVADWHIARVKEEKKAAQIEILEEMKRKIPIFDITYIQIEDKLNELKNGVKK